MIEFLGMSSATDLVVDWSKGSMPLRDYFPKKSKSKDMETDPGGTVRPGEQPPRNPPPRGQAPGDRQDAELAASQVPEDEHLERRIRQAVESLLGNESLTADLNDAAATELLDWGTARAIEIVNSTAGMDEAQAEEAMYPQMRALRSLMRALSKLVGEGDQLGVGRSTQLIDEIFEQGGILYGEPLSPTHQDLHQALGASGSQEQVRRILDLIAPSRK
jgi:hypothetical protein